ncbi:MAG: hypothetical protein K2Q22_13900, partial [Cytophagales bacterium]|nr:hypothetical protein [Cytophagales bacterium]
RKDLGTQLKRVEFPLLAGLTYSFKRGLLEVGCTYFYQNPYQYYINTTDQVTLNVPNFSFNVDYKYFFDFSVVSLKKDKNGENEKLMEKLRKTKSLNSFMVSAGPAYSFFVGHSSYNSTFRPYLDDYRISEIYPDVSVGYYHQNWDVGANLSYRNVQATLQAYGTSQTVKRHSVAIEGFKFFWDYHGFVPFVGLSLSHESIYFRETDPSGVKFDQWNNFFTPGLVGGWDIRPTRSDWWGIRTNIRYYPFLQWHVQNGTNIDLQSLELNFLQLVLYPNKMYGAFLKEN